MKNTYEERAEKFIRKTLAPMFSTIRAEKNLERSFKRVVKNYNDTHKIPLKMDSGATRFVIIRNDYVIKISLANAYNEQFGDNMTEMEAYKMAVKAGYEYLFAKPTLIEIDNMAFEIMPKVNNIGICTKFFGQYLSPKEYRWVMRHFDDLHCGNVGYYKNRPIFIDYACVR